MRLGKNIFLAKTTGEDPHNETLIQLALLSLVPPFLPCFLCSYIQLVSCYKLIEISGRPRSCLNTGITPEEHSKALISHKDNTHLKQMFVK